MRKNMIALAAALALGTATMSTAAVAAQRGGTFGGGGGGHIGGGAPGGHAVMGGGAGTLGGMHGNFGAANVGRPSGPGNFARTAPGNFAGNRNNFVGTRGTFAGRDFDRDRHHRFHGFGLGFGGLYAYEQGYYDGDYADTYYGDSCWQRRLVPTPFGLRWRPVDVCEY